MVIKAAVIGPLGLHILSSFSNGTAAGGYLSLEKFQLLAAPLHPVAASIPLDGSALGQREADLAEAEGFGEGDYLAFPLIHPDAHGLKQAHNLSGDLFQPLDVRQDNVVIIHVVGGAVDPGLALYPVVHGAREGHHLLLGWLHAQRHPPPGGRAGGACDNCICQGQEARVEDELAVSVVKGGVGSIGEEALQVQEENGSLAAIPAEMPVKLLLQAAIRPMEPLVFLGSSIVVYHARAV